MRSAHAARRSLPRSVGKGTFANKIAPLLGVPAISTGDIIRAEIKAGSALGAQCKAFTESGKLVPDEVVSAMVRKRLSEPDAQKGWILDGYPRTVQQAKDLDAAQVRPARARAQRPHPITRTHSDRTPYTPPRRRSAAS